uniref:Deoxyribonuclease II n=1 Tax=Globodera rostochiensis TaxID=31243 RepID=A0A914HTD3_GLORO
MNLNNLFHDCHFWRPRFLFLGSGDVDWFVSYKLPDLGSEGDGTAFVYSDANSASWRLSDKSVEDKRSAIGLTVSQLFTAKSKKGDFFALFNDENPNSGKTDSNRAHMKGVLVFDDISGFWLVHSVPKFPSSKETFYVYPRSGKRNGQSLLCITLSSASLREIGRQLFVAQPNIYDFQLPNSFASLFPDLAKAVNRTTFPYKKRPSFSVIEHKRYGKDLYSDLVAPQLKTSLYVETWLVGRGDLPSNCSSPYKIHNVLSVKLSKFAFKSTEDHSKWAVSESGQWTCIGDINRQLSQARRGGGTVCLSNAKIASLYKSAVDKAECCKEESHC